MVRGLWDFQVDAIIDIKIGDNDADSYTYEPMVALLARWETIKNDKRGKQYHNKQKHFSPFVLPVNGILGREDVLVLSPLIQVMAEKRENPLLQVQGWVNGLIAIAVARSYSQMIHGARLPSTLRERDLDWDLESGIGLAG